MNRPARTVLYLVFVLTGFSALTLQVTWQRVISLHTGVDLMSFTTVVAAFLAGIGLGSLAGGALADRLGPARAVPAFAVSNLAIGSYALASIWLFHDLYQLQAANLTTIPAKFAFNTALLAAPTTLMGLSLPLVARGVVARRADAGVLVGRLYAVNTAGAALGAAVTGWLLLGSIGFAAVVRLAAVLHFLAAVAAAVAHRLAGVTAATAPVTPAVTGGGPTSRGDGQPRPDPVWPWYGAYALTGAVALGFEIVFFRVVDTVIRSNSYSFAHVLSLYLALFGAGAAIAAPLVRRARRPAVWFGWIELAIGATALAGLIVLTRGLHHSPWAGAVRAWFSREGYVVGFTASGLPPGALGPVLVGAPLLLMGLPVLGMGAAYPFAQALVTQRLSSLGRRTGGLLFANVAGNVVGTLVVGFVALDRLGTAGTYRALGLALLAPGVVAAWATARPPGRLGRRVAAVAAVVSLMALLVSWVPGNEELYARLHGTGATSLHLAEDRSCAAALRGRPGGVEELTVNASPQNDYPFDDFHLVLGLTPSLLHDDPRQVMVLGLGIGATPYGITLDRRVERIRTVEICGSQRPLLEGLAARRSAELRHLFTDPRVDIQIGDGRDHLLRERGRLDVVVVDTLRPQAAFSGNLYSTEFYRLVHDRLGDDGLLAQWVPTARSLNSVLSVFPHVVQFATPSYHGSTFFVAGRRPFLVDPATLTARLGGAGAAASGLPAERRHAVDQFFGNLRPECTFGRGPVPAPDEVLDRDLHPRDEYFLNQPAEVPLAATCAGGDTPASVAEASPLIR